MFFFGTLSYSCVQITLIVKSSVHAFGVASHLGSMVNRQAMFDPVFEQVLAKRGRHVFASAIRVQSANGCLRPVGYFHVQYRSVAMVLYPCMVKLEDSDDLRLSFIAIFKKVGGSRAARNFAPAESLDFQTRSMGSILVVSVHVYRVFCSKCRCAGHRAL